ncbi:replication protein A 70 kDa DNA-binding subunit B-like [Abeliophyllum distichum]|uniref:Replication protein A 70 kDa DNA-binding subunit B-like n=1 Tax=Abeliophyllum distichum TaxID=126358 RepID=A0ABD1Q3R7_9LAMI
MSHNMSNELRLIREVSPGTTRWTINVTLAEKFSPRIAQKSPTKYQNLILMDSEGSTVQATLYGQNITAFQDELILKKTYLISNALVKVTGAEYRAKSGEVQWTISGRTRIRSVQENNSSLLIFTYSFIDFEDLPKYMDSNIDISLSLSTKADSSFFIDGEFEIVEEFKSCGYINASAIKNLAEYFLQTSAENLMEQALTFTPSVDSLRLSIDEDEVFYVKAIPHQFSLECKFEILFIVNPSEVGDMDKGKAPVKDVDDIDLANTHLMEPRAKRSLFHSDSDDA